MIMTERYAATRSACPDWSGPEGASGCSDGAQRHVPRELHTLSVLVVDDNEPTRIIISEMLTDLGVYHRLIEDGRAIGDALAEQSFDLLLTDCHMPEMDGFEAVRLLRDVEARVARLGFVRRLTVVAVTADSSEETRARCLAAGMDGVLLKPLEPRVLEEVLRKLLRQSPANGHPQQIGKHSPTTTAALGNAPIDLAGILVRYGGKRDLARLVLQLFCEQLQNDVSALERHCRQGAFSPLFLAAHTLKGAATAVGATQLRSITLELEHLARTRELDGVPQLLITLRDEAKRCVNYIATLDLGSEGRSDA